MKAKSTLKKILRFLLPGRGFSNLSTTLTLSVYRKKSYMIFDDLALTKFLKPHFTGFSGVILTKSTALCPHWGYQFTDRMLLRV